MPSLKQTVLFLPLAALVAARPVTVHVSPTSPTTPTSPISPEVQQHLDTVDVESIASVLQGSKRENGHYASYTQTPLTHVQNSLDRRADDKQKGSLRVITQLGSGSDAISPPNSPEGEGGRSPQNKYPLAVSPLSPAPSDSLETNPFNPNTDSKKYWEHASKQAKAMKKESEVKAKQEAEKNQKLGAGKRLDPARKEQLEAQKRKQLEAERMRPKLNLMDQAWRNKIDQAGGQGNQEAAANNLRVNVNQNGKATKR
ncbi:hypothetical protein GGTG_05740 [Gaeumannomyces tritici R3-111a-1]|uniref:Uncharacterized protein n=1 Tax=Gaeumannomyces tritici (strain R3-111a-1) TaxID=644352 RepID=J3NWS9_GAET3|nr:hypothetical protein GGTG_05740 [Gaeumannomyces tritici R3-111a-1]EJT75811.1 hypothetical protein GGTG_05740 [Gaeumannomyces tritici R3-111a-1]